MGGSSGIPGGGYVPRNPKSGGGGEGSPGEDPCSFTITTSVASPNPSVIAALQPGNVLAVSLNSGGATPIVEVQTTSGMIAGTIAGIPNLRALIGCLQLGVRYEFRITAVTGGRVDGVLRNT